MRSVHICYIYLCVNDRILKLRKVKFKMNLYVQVQQTNFYDIYIQVYVYDVHLIWYQITNYLCNLSYEKKMKAKKSTTKKQYSDLIFDIVQSGIHCKNVYIFFSLNKFLLIGLQFHLVH